MPALEEFTIQWEEHSYKKLWTGGVRGAALEAHSQCCGRWDPTKQLTTLLEVDLWPGPGKNQKRGDISAVF